MRSIRVAVKWHGSRLAPLLDASGMTVWGCWRVRYQNASTRDSMLCRFSVPGTVAGSANAVCGM